MDCDARIWESVNIWSHYSQRKRKKKKRRDNIQEGGEESIVRRLGEAALKPQFDSSQKFKSCNSWLPDLNVSLCTCWGKHRRWCLWGTSLNFTSVIIALWRRLEWVRMKGKGECVTESDATQIQNKERGSFGSQLHCVCCHIVYIVYIFVFLTNFESLSWP